MYSTILQITHKSLPRLQRGCFAYLRSVKTISSSIINPTSDSTGTPSNIIIFPNTISNIRNLFFFSRKLIEFFIGVQRKNAFYVCGPLNLTTKPISVLRRGFHRCCVELWGEGERGLRKNANTITGLIQTCERRRHFELIMSQGRQCSTEAEKCHLLYTIFGSWLRSSVSLCVSVKVELISRL